MQVNETFLESPNFIQLRIPKPSKVSMRTIFFSAKLNLNIQVANSENYIFENKFGGESHLEDVLLIMAEQSPQVLEYLPQSMPKNEHGVAYKLRYTWNNTSYDWIPDLCILINNNGILEIWVIEVKPLASLTKKSLKNRLQIKYEFAKQICERKGWKFYLFTDLFKNNTWRFENIYDLRSQLRWINQNVVDRVISLFEKEDKLKIKDIIASLFNYPSSQVRAALYLLIYKEKLFIDLANPLNENSIVSRKLDNYSLIEWLNKFHFNNREKFLLDELDIDIPEDKTQWEKEMDIQINLILKYYREGKSYRIISEKVGQELQINISKSKIGRIIQQSQHGLLNHVPLRGRKGSSGPSKKELFTVLENGKPVFHDKYFKKAVEAFESPLQIIFKDAWKIYYVQIRLDNAVIGIVQSNSTVQELLENIPDMASKFVFHRNLKDYIKLFENRVVSKREGFKKANKLHRDVRARTPHKSYIGQTVEIDHTPSDILPIINPTNYLKSLRNKKYKLEKMPRPSLTIAIDRHSRVIVGYALRYKSPSSETNHLVLRRVMLGNVSPLYSDEMKKLASSKEKIRIGYQSLYNREIITEDTYFGTLNLLKGNIGDLADWFDNIRVIPHTLSMDNGSDFTSSQFAFLGKNLEIDFNYRPVGGSNYGGIVERAIKTINYDAFHNLPGTTKGTIDQKGDLNPDDYKILKFDELEAVLLLKLLEYHIEPHSGLNNLTPKIMWDNGIEKGHVIHPHFENDKDLLKYYNEIAFQTLPIALNSNNKIPPYHENKGIVLSKIWYNYTANNLFSNDKSWSYIYSKGNSIEARQSKDDVRFVYWHNKIIDKVVKVWATEIRLNGIQYSGKSLQKLPPISLEQVNDDEALINIINRAELLNQERLQAEIENSRVSSTLDMINKAGSKKKQSKLIAQNQEKQAVINKESDERNQQFGMDNSEEKITVKQKSRKKKKKGKIDWNKLPDFPNISEEDKYK